MTYHNQFLVIIEKEHLTIDLNEYIPKADFAGIDFFGAGTTYMLNEPRFPVADDEHTVYKMVGVRLYTNASNITIDIICESLNGSRYIIQADKMIVDGETIILIDQ